MDLDGCYVYRRLILPIYDENGAYIAADINGNYQVYYKESSETEPILITDYVQLYDNAHIYGQEIFIGEKLGLSTCKLKNCLLSAQKASIDLTLKNGCDFSCLSKTDNYKRDFLLAAMLVLDYYIQAGETKKALLLLQRLHACGGICDDSQTPDCGCGGK